MLEGSDYRFHSVAPLPIFRFLFLIGFIREKKAEECEDTVTNENKFIIIIFAAIKIFVYVCVQ
ncbi:hypothetical protein LEP1GSC050_2895 [Leptospira broomii serovar Hurstbridge str. 5399]|uniref:Uncharacterized protein n=1 Tax=Leptospira broomii serovar Hurstbridge str. 5399 TaxID=1049789 RepID=T0GG91_9LEPT|nr:hypothetical protein LEP1GSC050_2895 [Leptospira broomii serovar Hurstbridge str. 5399]